MLRVILFGVVIFHLWSLTTAACIDSCGCECLQGVRRYEWRAWRPRAYVAIKTPVGMVFVYHTAMSRCHNLLTCSAEVSRIQNLHMDIRGWNNIGYNYLVGEDGRVYEGRGLETKGFNRDAITIAVMGNFTSQVPNEKALNALKILISCSLETDILTSDYRLYGQRGVLDTASTGNSLHNLIQSWPHYDFNAPSTESFFG